MKNKALKRKCGQNNGENVVEYERVRKEQITIN